MSEMVERVAKAIFDAWAQAEGAETTWEELVEAQGKDGYAHSKKHYKMAVDEARAAISVMMEPTDDMENAGWEQLPDLPDDWSPISAYQRMIEAALK
jgi:hypothetical protein